MKSLTGIAVALMLTSCADSPHVPAVHCEAEMAWFEQAESHGTDYTIQNNDEIDPNVPDHHQLLVEVWDYPTSQVWFIWTDNESGCDLIEFATN